MLRALDRVAPPKVAIPMGILTAAGLVGLGMYQPVFALGGGAILICVALLLSLSAQWRLEGNPDPVTAGVEFEAPDEPAARWIGWACVLLGGAVLVYGAIDTARVRLTTAWDAMPRAVAVAAVPDRGEASPARSDKPTDAMLAALKRQRDALRAAASAASAAPAKKAGQGRRERPVRRVGADGVIQPTAADDAEPARGSEKWALDHEKPAPDDAAETQLAREAAARASGGVDAILNAVDKPDPSRGPPLTARDGAALPEKLTRAQVRKVMGANFSKVRACKSADPRLNGTVKIAMVVGKSGRVKSAKAASPFTGTAVGVCVERAVKALRFPEFSGDDMRINMPFTL